MQKNGGFLYEKFCMLLTMIVKQSKSHIFNKSLVTQFLSHMLKTIIVTNPFINKNESLTFGMVKDS